MTFDCLLEGDQFVRMRDGVALSVSVYRPSRDGRGLPGPFPVLLERTPYGKRRAVSNQAGEFFARQGYVVVMQDVRGRFASEGEWYFLAEHEGPDGFDTVAWIAAQPWCDGNIGTMGLSYSTATQQALAVLRPPGLKAQFLSDGGYDYFHRTLRHSGAFELGVLLPYVVRLAREGPDLAKDPERRAAFEAELDGLRPWLDRLPLRKGESFLRHAPREERWFFDMLTTSRRDAYWTQPTLSLKEHVDAYPDIPLFFQTSWYGHHVWATIEKYRALRLGRTSPMRLLIGSWLHGYDDFARSYAGAVDFGPEARIDFNALRLLWFDATLKGADNGILRGPDVHFFVLGGGSGGRDSEGRLKHGGSWRDATTWPLSAAKAVTFHLHPDRRLRLEPQEPGGPPHCFIFDPIDPVPTVGGGVQNGMFPRLIQGGAYDQRGRDELWVCADTEPLASRADILVFETEPLNDDLEVTGPVSVRLFVSSSAKDTDFTAKLIDVYPPSPDWPQGFAMNLTDSVARCRYREGFDHEAWLEPGRIVEIAIEPQPISNVFAKGHKIRLDISSSNFPRFDVNPNTGEPCGLETRVEVAANRVYGDADHPSALTLHTI
ncbi:MAG: CocE/NonD family hydrolase [Vicinamibacteria bacterium]|nr:CocE/NonD family hydrolase [Vicinamibacteria bacterium]